MLNVLNHQLPSKPKDWYESMEKKIASVLIGTIMMLWSPLGLDQGQGRGGSLYKALNALGVEDEWFYTMFIVGTMLVVTSFCPLRKLRHMAHFFAVMIWLATFGVLVTHTGIRVVSLTFIAFAGASLAILIADVRGKPRGTTST